MRRILIGFILLFALSGVTKSHAASFDFLEEFAISSDRSAVLKRLIPGTRDYYYYYALHYQVQGKLKKVDALLKRWESRYRYDSRRKSIKHRQALLRYATNPKSSLSYLLKALNIRLNHFRTVATQKPNYPTFLDPKRIGWKTLSKKAMAGSRYNLYRFTDDALFWLLRQNLSGSLRRRLLRRLKHPAFPGLVAMIAADLSYKYSGGFGSLTVHRKLTLAQLDALSKVRPSLLKESRFVNTYLRKLRPNAEQDWRHTLTHRKAYLKSLWSFVSKLPPSFNSLKLNVLYHQLRFERSQGVFDQQKFITYIQLPRYASYVNRGYVSGQQDRAYVASRYRGYSYSTGLSRVGNDEPLIKSFLRHFFKTEGGYQSYTAYLKAIYLKRVFAETKLLFGKGSPEKWFSMLRATQLKKLRERVVLNFAPTNKKVFGAKEPVSLALDLKNIKTLIVKVYRVNTKNYYRKKKSAVRADLKLDGLVANSEKVYQFKVVQPIRMQRRVFTFPTLKSRGVYIVDFIGNGKNSRALIRKGKLRVISRVDVAGHVLHVLNEDGTPAPRSYVWCGHRTYHADKSGAIRLPFTARPGWKNIMLGSGDFVSLARIYHRREFYEFQASIFVDREALLSRKQATVLVRPRLLVSGSPAPLSLIKGSTLVMTARDRFGVKTQRKFSPFKLYEGKESKYTFRVPENLSSITFTLRGKVKNVSKNKMIHVRRSRTFTINQVDRRSQLASLHLGLSSGEYHLDILDRTGRPWAHRVVSLSLRHRGLRYRKSYQLQTNKSGRIVLGALRGVSHIFARSGKTRGSWSLRGNLNDMPFWLHGKVGEPLLLPYPGKESKPTREAMALLEKRSNTYVADRFSALHLQGGLLSVKGLPVGNYELILHKLNRTVAIRVTKGSKVSSFLVGKRRILRHKSNQPLQVSSVKIGPKKLKIQLAHSSSLSRVHVFATRYLPRFHPYQFLRFRYLWSRRARRIDWWRLPRVLSDYRVGRTISDEYRYILERKYKKKYPGNMLQRPSLLLNPWAVRKTQTRSSFGSSGSGFGRGGGRPASKRFRGRGGLARGGKLDRGRYTDPNLDFLPQQSATLVNLKPDANGVVSVPLSALGGHSIIHVLAIDPEHTAYHRVSRKEKPLRARDLRLYNNLSSKKHYSQQSRIVKVPQGGTFKLADVSTSKFEITDSLRKVYALFSTLRPNHKLRKFQFLLRWPKMKMAEKRKLYSKFASHELNFFLYKKDSVFFQKVVLSYLRNKKDKTFLDHWLLGVDLTSYLRPWAYSQLNVVERILLAQRVANETGRTSRHVRELLELVRPNPAQERAHFETVLMMGALHTQGQMGAARRLADQLRAKVQESARRRWSRTNRIDDNDRTAAPAPAPPSKSLAVPEDAKKSKEAKVRRRRYRKSKFRWKKRLEGYAKSLKERATLRQFYRALEKTKEWAENNYYQLSVRSQGANLVRVNAFWSDYASHDSSKPFLSKHVTQASRNFTEMMFALAVLDLPFESPKHSTKLKQTGLTLKATSGLLAFYRSIQEAGTPRVKAPVLVSQNFFEYGRRYRYVRGRRVERYINDEFLARKAYGCQIVVTNPTGTRKKLRLLVQVPQGSMPVLNGKYTRTLSVDLGAYRTRRFTYYFYFPKAGSFEHFPVHVSQGGKLVAYASPKAFRVVNKPTKLDKKSWNYISRQGTAKDVLAYLANNNLRRVNLNKVVWRMKDKATFEKVIALLRKNHRYHAALWGYGFKHNNLKAIQDFLQHRTYFLRRLGMSIQSPLVTLNPIVRKTYEHLEYSPLVNARAHRLGKKRRILNNRFAAQYRRFVRLLMFQKDLSAQQLMAGTYYLLLQDRVAKAASLFARINPKQLSMRLQYDYLKVYLSFYTGALKEARAIAEGYRKYPVLRWQNRFVNALNQMDEIEGKTTKSKVADPKNRAQKQSQLASTSPSFHFRLKGKEVVISHRNVKTFKVHYYLMDIELLFSCSPFVQKHSNQFAFIQPNLVKTVTATAKGNQTTFVLPKQFHNSNVMIEISGGGLQRSKAYFSNSLDVQISENYGQLRVSSNDSNQALSKIYVKVYARLKNGSVAFYKDGYTDLRGRFDYASLSTDTLKRTQRFSILVLSPKYGAVVREVKPPKQ